MADVFKYEHGRRVMLSPITASAIWEGQTWMTTTGKRCTILGVTRDGFATVRYELELGTVCSMNASGFQRYYRLCVDGPCVPRAYR